MSQPIPPVEHHVSVRLAPAEAFVLFTRQMARWWPFRGHSGFDAAAVDVRFDERVGGQVVEHAADGRTMTWGELTAWQPPERFVMRWYPGLNEAEATELVVSFTPLDDGGTRVAIHHSGWEARGAQAGTKRDQYDGGWPHTLAAFAAFTATADAGRSNP